MNGKENLKHDYKMIKEAQEWPTPNGETVLNFENPNHTDIYIVPPKLEYDDSYDIAKLDYIWYPLLRKNLQNGHLAQRSQDGVPLVRVASEADDTVDYVPSSDRPLSSFDEIDARGSFNAQDLERDLRQMQRRELGK